MPFTEIIFICMYNLPNQALIESKNNKLNLHTITCRMCTKIKFVLRCIQEMCVEFNKVFNLLNWMCGREWKNQHLGSNDANNYTNQIYNN